MVTCRVCGMETSGQSVCGFCKAGTKVTPDLHTFRRLVDAIVHRGYADNVRQPTEQPSQPANIKIPQEQIDDILRMNEWMKDILDLAYKRFPPGTQLYVLRAFAIDAINDVNLLLKSKQRFDPRALPVIVDKEWTDKYWKVLELIEHTYGRLVPKWFESKPQAELKRQRMLLYINLWHLGHLYRHGYPALSVSPWLTGERKPLAGDPFGSVPVGQER
jgi:hypothetical protein